MAKQQMACNCHKGTGIWMLIIGILLTINVYKPFMSLGLLIGIMLIIAGILKMATRCNCNK